MRNFRLRRQPRARLDESAEFGFLDRRQERHALKFIGRHQQPAPGLRHGFDQQHARHQRIAREVPLEDRTFGRYRGLAANRTGGEIETDDPVD